MSDLRSKISSVKSGLFALLWIAIAAAHAGDCKRTATRCIDSTPSKNISGTIVTLAEVGGCWMYEDTYVCLKPNAVDYCKPLSDAGCRQTNSQCAQYDTLMNSGCMRYTQTYRCDDPSMPTPSNTIRLSDTYTLISSNYDPGPCQSLDNNTNCSIAESKCVSTTPASPLPPGIDPTQVAPDGCYQKQNTYACLTGRVDSSECDGYAANPNCKLQSSTCTDTVSGQCILEQRTYQCMSRPPKTSTITDCSGQLFCQNGNCFDKGYPNDTDFARAMALMEAAREAGVYGNETSIFSGTDSRCKIKLSGLVNCCKKSGGAKTNNDVLTQLAVSAGLSLAGSALSAGSKVASPYMYDFMFSSGNDWMVNRAVEAWMSGGWNPNTTFMDNFKPSISLYGFTFGFGSTAAEVAASASQAYSQLPGFVSDLIGVYNSATHTLATNVFGIEGLNLTFNPYALAFSVAMMIISELMSCDQQEQILAMLRGQNLCHEVGSYCTKKFIKTCIEHTKSYCCYNSRLARIINEQGRAQIGKGWGSAKNPNCSGFTQSEFAAIDFSKIDLSEFMEEVMANIKMPNIETMNQKVQTSVQQKIQNYYQRGTKK